MRSGQGWQTGRLHSFRTRTKLLDQRRDGGDLRVGTEADDRPFDRGHPWAPSNPLPADGRVALWVAQAYAHRGAVVSYFRWQAATVAPDLMHCCILRHDESLNRGEEEIAALELAGRPNAAVDAQVAHD